jgi:hypothetical protein
MLKAGPKSIFALAVVLTLCKCIDPYSPKLKGYESLLVVDGLVTDENKSYTVKLSRTLQDQNDTPPMVSDATVFITDNAGNYCYLNNMGDGIYKTDSSQFRGQTGKTYVLHINTPEGENYESDQCLMQSVPHIDSIYFAKDQEVVNNGTEIQEGIRIYLDSEEGDNNLNYRWTFEETWEFKVPNPKRFNFLYLKPGLVINRIVKVEHVKEFCWKNRKSDEILIRAVYAGEPNQIRKEPLFFIATGESDRLMIKYSILVKQYSISKNEYDFWDNLKKVNSSGADIFAAQPYPVTSNIHSIKNPNEWVLGYFQVSAVTQKRKNIHFNDIAAMNVPFYQYTCETMEFEPRDFDTPQSPPKTWDDVYWYLCVVSNYTFTEPKYFPGRDSLWKMVFTRPECANCELFGSSVRPGFWNELN